MKKNPKKINVRHVSNVWNIKLEFLSLDSVIYLEFPFCVLKHNNLLLVRFQNGLRDHLSTTYFDRIFIEQKHMLSNLITSKSLSQLWCCLYKQFKSGWEGIRRFVSIYDLPSKTTFRHGVNVGWIFTTVFIVILEEEGYVMGINLNNTPKSLLTAKYVNTIPCKNRWVNSVIDCNNKRGIPGPYR